MPGETVLVIDDSPTILKVVQLVLTKAGFRVVTAADGEAGLDAAREHKPALILLDFVMPRMNGYQFCRELADDAAIKDIPVVLMSAKGDQVGERFVKVMGIVDYITKPFSPEAITAVVQHTVAKYARLTRDEFSDALLPGADGDQAETAAPEGDEARTRAIDGFRDRIAREVARKVAALFELADAANRGRPGSTPATSTSADAHADTASETAGEDDSPASTHAAKPSAQTQAVPTDPDAVADAARAALTDEVIEELLVQAEPLFTSGDQAPSLRGELRVVPIASVLQLFDSQEQSGVLAVQRTVERVEVYFRRGRVDLAIATGVSEEFLLGRFIVDSELMTQEDFDGFLDSRGGTGSKLIGGQLVKLGYITEDDLKAALRRQTSELIYEVLRWSFGSFRFTATRDLPNLAVEAALGLDIEAVLMEGFRRVDEWHLIEREVDDFDLVFLRNEDAVTQMGRGRLTREELAILELVNGKNTVKDIIRKSRMGSFDVSKMLYRLLSIKLIRRRVMPVAV